MNQTVSEALSELTDSEGGPARPRSLDSLWVPGRVRVDGGWLIWSAVDESGQPNPPDEKPPPPGRVLLEGFLQLDPERPETIRDYAQRYGPLYLCEMHRLPL